MNGGEGSSAKAAAVLTTPSSQIQTYLESAQCLVHTAADRQVVHGSMLNDSLSVDDEQPSKSDSLPPPRHTTISNPHSKQRHEVASDAKNRQIETGRIQNRCRTDLSGDEDIELLADSLGDVRHERVLDVSNTARFAVRLNPS